MSSVPIAKCSSEKLSIQEELYSWLASWHHLIGDLPSQQETLSQNIGLRVSEEWQLRLSSSLYTNWHLYSPVLTYIYTHMNTCTHTRPVCCLWFQLFYQAPFNKKLAPYWGSLLLDSQVGIDSHLTGALIVQTPWSFLRCAWTWLLWILFCTVSFVSICFYPTLFTDSFSVSHFCSLSDLSVSPEIASLYMGHHSMNGLSKMTDVNLLINVKFTHPIWAAFLNFKIIYSLKSLPAQLCYPWRNKVEILVGETGFSNNFWCLLILSMVPSPVPLEWGSLSKF